MIKKVEDKGLHEAYWKCKCTVCGWVRICSSGNLKTHKYNKCNCNWLKPNIYKKCGNYYKVFLNQDDNRYFLIDEEDYPIVSQHKWCLDKGNYVVNRKIKIHNFIYREKVPDGYVLDHINGNPCDNRKANFRLCKHSQNMRNTKISNKNISGHKGVWFDKEHGQWCASIKVDNKNIWLGRHDTYDEAVRAREKAEQEYHGEYSTKESRGSYNSLSLEEILDLDKEIVIVNS